MRKDILREVAGYLAGIRHRRTWRKVVSVLACVVVFCTVYALILPAITLEKTCTPESLGLHKHTDACVDENGQYRCGYADFFVHEHNENCFDADGNLRCTFPEIKPHTHDESCYAQTETTALHTHTDECYGAEQGELICQLSAKAAEPAGRTLICGKEEIVLHKHDANCLDKSGSLICGQTQVLEHMHTEACFRTAEKQTETEGLSGETEKQTDKLSGETEKQTETDKLSKETEKQTETDKLSGETEKQTETDKLSGETEKETGKLSGESEEPANSAAGRVPGRMEAPSARQETTALTVTNTGDSSAAAVKLWMDDMSDAQGRLQTALFAIDQGYTIREVQYYQISGLTGEGADVKYVSGRGLSAANPGAKVFVYELGADGKAAPKGCETKEAQKEENLFTSFHFKHPAGNASRIYAFISASPATLEEMGIYTGEQQADDTWVACDGPSETDAGVKVTVTLPKGTSAPEGCKLFIRKIYEGENFYPAQGAVQAKAGEFWDWQCYTIRWIKREPDGSLHMESLNESGAVQVRIEYLKDNAKLKGTAGGRKLLIFNSNQDGSLVDRVADSVKDVRVGGDKYQSFTFQAAQAGPYVFVSKKLEMGYIDALQISKVIDGSGPFDQSDDPGYDSSDSNKIVRSYDTIEYNLEATFGARQAGITAEKVNMYFELTLKKSATAARFDTSKMVWLGSNYSIEYLDNDGNVIMIMDQDGHYYLPKKDGNGNIIREEHGFARADKNQPVSMNAQLTGSTSGEGSYKVASGGVATQRLVGWTELKANKGESILSGTQTFSMAVEVRNADHGEIFAPAFRMWLEGNEDNYGPEGTEGENMLPATPDLDNIVDISKEANSKYQVTVSAGTNFNVQVKKNTDMSYKNWFDFSTGNIVAEPARAELVRLANLQENHGKSDPAKFTENGAPLSEEKKREYSKYRYGRITGYGIALQLYNHTDNPQASAAAKGLKGLSLPVGDITFDLNFYSSVTSDVSVVDENEYTAILWDYNENVPANTSYTRTYLDPGRGKVTTPNDGKGNGGRNLYWDGETRSPYAKGGAPSNYIANSNGCYYGGDWFMLDGNGGKVNTLASMAGIASPTVVTGTGKNTTYHFSVSDYDFDFDNQHFPLQDAGNSGTVEGYDTYKKCFSAGYVQVLSVFPMVQKVSEAEIFLHTEVKNLHLKTRAGQELKAADVDETKIEHEVNTEDNIKKDQIVLYAPGNLTKGSAFNGKKDGKEPTSTNEGFLGTDYWTTSYDCSTFAGDDIWIICYGMLSPGSDYRTRSMNLLQLFDSHALSIRGVPRIRSEFDPAFDKPGNVKFLYAADPDHLDGYDTNKDGVLKYMNSVREEDLVYFDSLEELQKAGYTCIGVLMEMRDCDLLSGKYQYMRIPVKVNGDEEELVGKTVATVNTFRVWSETLGNITWADGKWDETTGKNVLENFPKPKNGIVNDQYSGELANQETTSPPYYVKTEYEDGLQVKGTHAGGTLAGNSLLILGYRASVDIGVDNKPKDGKISYNLGNGETVVDYRVQGIRTEISDFTSQTDNPTTTLTIKVALDVGNTDKRRISVSGGSYKIGAEAISTDPVSPTAYTFTGSDGKQHTIKIHAQVGRDNQTVTFVIQDAPVKLQLPDITFQANLETIALNNNDTITARADISGQGDNRAYDQTKGNRATVDVSIVKNSSTNLTKAVKQRYIELNGEITYDVTYTNSGSEDIGKIYFYDLIPNVEDIRGSKFNGEVALRKIEVSGSDNPLLPLPEGVNMSMYYSTTEYRTLYDKVKVFGGVEDPKTGKITGMNEQKVNELLSDTKYFNVLGKGENGKFEYEASLSEMNKEELSELMSHVTGLYAVVNNLGKGQTIKMTITVETEDNEANDWYKNIANSWIVGSATLPLTSNKVETQSVSRNISGVVWHDENLNGIRDSGERLLSGVTATLFKKKDKSDEYDLCDRDVTGQPISPVTTNEYGVYSFDKLSDGNYIVAFSGPELEKFTGATTYQKNGTNDANTNDGVKNNRATNRAALPGEYAYYICYSEKSEKMPLHKLKDMEEGKVDLVNGVEWYANQDLGLIIATHELPQTGGPGTTPYTIGGLLLIAAWMLLLYKKNKYRKEDLASS